MTTMELIERGIGHNCLSDAYDLGRADAIDEFLSKAKARKYHSNITRENVIAIAHLDWLAKELKEENK